MSEKLERKGIFWRWSVGPLHHGHFWEAFWLLRDKDSKLYPENKADEMFELSNS